MEVTKYSIRRLLRDIKYALYTLEFRELAKAEPIEKLDNKKPLSAKEVCKLANELSISKGEKISEFRENLLTKEEEINGFASELLVIIETEFGIYFKENDVYLKTTDPKKKDLKNTDYNIYLKKTDLDTFRKRLIKFIRKYYYNTQKKKHNHNNIWKKIFNKKSSTNSIFDKSQVKYYDFFVKLLEDLGKKEKFNVRKKSSKKRRLSEKINHNIKKYKKRKRKIEKVYSHDVTKFKLKLLNASGDVKRKEELFSYFEKLKKWKRKKLKKIENSIKFEEKRREFLQKLYLRKKLVKILYLKELEIIKSQLKDSEKEIVLSKIYKEFKSIKIKKEKELEKTQKLIEKIKAYKRKTKKESDVKQKLYKNASIKRKRGSHKNAIRNVAELG